ncbi:DNA-binding transcriptional LysR family regulator [Variovorax sp. GrIS 2.14]|uniref:LysR family transcriptional regulator n=1 Tax=Variovorax sp. GrIS 2.14 TaxID=3071709 RepID=UPI0038F709F8
MELRHLRYFLAVAEAENVRLASEHLHVTQPAISRQVHDLEEELGVELFDRLSRGLRLNASGHAFMKDVTALMTSLEAACDRVRRVFRGEIGALKVGFVEIAGWEGVIPQAIRQYREAVPSVHLEPWPLGTPEQLNKIQDGTLDGGFVYLFGNCPDDIETIPLQHHGAALAVLRNARSVSKSEPSKRIRLKDLSNEKFVVFHRSVYPAYFDALLVACSAGGLVPRVVQQVQSEAAVLSLVTSGIGVAIVNDRNRFRAPTQVEFAKISDLKLSLPLSFAYRKDVRNPALLPLLQILRSVKKSPVLSQV